MTVVFPHHDRRNDGSVDLEDVGRARGLPRRRRLRPGTVWPNIGVNVVFMNHALGDTPLVGDREVGTHLVVKYVDTTTDPDIAETGAMGTATVTAWDFTSQQFSGTVDVTTESGRTIQVEFDVDGTDLMQR